jgi:uncharacterized protein (DUF2141 family)
MSKLTIAGALTAGLLLAAQPAAAQAAVGPDAAACNAGSGQTAVLVNVKGFRAATGSVRVVVYSGDPAEFLERGKSVRRVDLPVSATDMPVCVALPGPGRYAIAVRHDQDGNGQTGWSDGGGFSNNPRVALPNPRPRHEDVAIDVRPGVQPIEVVMNYRFGLSIRPVAGR